MTPETVLTLGRQGLEVMLVTSAPILAVILLIGLVITGPWMLTTLTDYLQRVLLSIPAVVNGQMGF